MKLNKNLWMLGVFLIFLIPLTQAVTIESGTDLYASGINLTFNFTATAYADSFSVESGSIYFENYSRDNGNEVITMNITEGNKTYNHTALPYFSSSTSTSKTITSTLADTITTDIIADISTHNCTELTKITYNSNGGTDQTYSDSDARDRCSNNLVTLTSSEVGNGANTLEFNYADAEAITSCNSVLGGFSALSSDLATIGFVLGAIVIIGLLFSIPLLGQGNVEIDPKMILIGVLTLFAIGFVLILSVSIIGGIC